VSGEKTEAPTAKRKKESRAEGRIARTPELSAWAGLFVATYALKAVGASAAQRVLGLFPDVAKVMARPDEQAALGLLGKGLLASVYAVLPLGIGLIGVGVAANVAQAGVPLSGKGLKPKLDRMNPVHAIKRIFSAQGAWETIKSIAKVSVLGAIGWQAMLGVVEQAVAAGHVTAWVTASETLDVALRFARQTALVGLGLAAIDYAVSRRRVGKTVRMTKQEVKDESKQSEGDQEVKAQIRAMQRRASRKRSLDAISRADAVIVNPTHIAVAIAYAAGSRAPEVLAIGAGSAATRIREVAETHNVPLVQDIPLARTLFRLCDVGDTVPAELFEAVARVLAFVYGLKRAGGAKRLDGAPHRITSGLVSAGRS
jgi:flagellar biosynthetic protein FlhB